MARAKLEYDDSGNTFYYFLVSFYALILLIVTYYLWPRKSEGDNPKGLVCQCEPCCKKKTLMDMDRPRRSYTNTIKFVVLVVMWGILLVMVYKILTLEKDYTEYDPFEILQLDPGATTNEIKKQYRKLSKVYHPDKEGGDQDMFMKIAKAYEALTDEVSRLNWEKYGNPDGPQAASFGIALPSWIVEKQNSVWVLGLYMGVFVVILPLIVGLWWYKSIKYSSTNVLLRTTQLFVYFFFRSKHHPMKRIIMILTASLEFNPQTSPLLKDRPSDNEELTGLIRSKCLPHVDVKTKEAPFYAPYATKTRMLVHAHLERVPLPPNTLFKDQATVLKHCPQLVQEMISQLTQLWGYRKSTREPPPSLDTFENVMRVNQMLVQGMWARGNSPLLQLPHLTSLHLRHFKTKKRNINTLEQFGAMKASERRSLVRSLTDEQYQDIIAVCSMYPHVEIDAETQVVDDEDHHRITAGSVVTVCVNLRRTGLLEFYEENDESAPVMEDGEIHVETLTSSDQAPSTNSQLRNRWDSSSSKKKRRGKGGSQMIGKQRRKPPNPKKIKKGSTLSPVVIEDNNSGREESEPEKELEMVNKQKKNDRNRRSQEDSDGGSTSGSESEKDDEEEWKILQQSMEKHKKKKFDKVSTKSYPVHAPYFPEEKQECWWLYIADKRLKELITPPQRITGLKEEFSTDLHFGAPEKLGPLRYTVVLESDSYLDLSFTKELKLNVLERQEVSGKHQWKELEEEEEAEELIEESDSDEDETSGGYTDSESHSD